jgi:hypothetical protein
MALVFGPPRARLSRMQRDLEDELERRIRAGEVARDVIADFVAKGRIASPKQAWATLRKWDNKGRWEYGVTFDLGWFVDP